jgi:hypothetical protein
MRVSSRLGGLVDLAIVVLAGLGVAVAWTRIGRHHLARNLTWPVWSGPLMTALLAFAVLADLWTGPIPLERLDRSDSRAAVAAWLATQPTGPVMEFPAESVFADPAAASVRRHEGESLFWSTRHWHSLVNGNSGFIPRPYSDFIERFVGEIDRPDATKTSRISHLDADSVALVQQIGVRYLVFHRSRYRSEDWPAVSALLASLAEDGVLEAAGVHGEATVYLVNPTAPERPPPRVSLYAPTLISTSSSWAPWIAVERVGGQPAALALTRPARLETTWYDAEGKKLWSGTERIPLPAVIDDSRLLCDATDCLTSRPFQEPPFLPPPTASDAWLPTTPGHYVVRLVLSGDQPLRCLIDLDLVATEEDVWNLSRDQPYRWARCIAPNPNPVNDPGLPPFTLSPPSVTLIGQDASVDIALTPRHDEEVRGWFILAPPGSTRPWHESVFESGIEQRLLAGGDLAAFEWREAVGATVEPGVYELTVWFHRRGPSGWEHAAGGDIDVAPVVVDADRTLRWAGPVRVRLAETVGPLAAGGTTTVHLAVDGTSDSIACVAVWSLSDGDRVVAYGNGGSCRQLAIAVPATVIPGALRLQIDAYAEESHQSRLSDALSIPVQITAGPPASGPR